MLRVRHLARIVADVGSHARLNKAWWILPFLVLIAAAVVAGGAAQTAVPYAVYTLF